MAVVQSKGAVSTKKDFFLDPCVAAVVTTVRAGSTEAYLKTTYKEFHLYRLPPCSDALS